MPAVDIVDGNEPEAQQQLKELEQEGFQFKDEVEFGRYDGDLRLLDYSYEVNIDYT